MKRLTIEPLGQSAFAPFGDVIDARREDAQRVSINDGFTQRHHALSPVQAEGNGPILSIFETRSFGFRCRSACWNAIRTALRPSFRWATAVRAIF